MAQVLYHAAMKFAIVLGLISCSSTPKPAAEPEHHHHGHHAHRFDNAEEWAKTFDDPARDAWQQPDAVLAALELTPAMAVADVGAGTGYFTVRLARAVPQGQVVATDIEPAMVKYLGERAQKEQLANVRAVLSGAADPKLDATSLDRILVVDVWHHIEDRPRYAKAIAAALKPGGQVAIVDFTLEANHGPPKEMRLAPAAIMAELLAVGLEAHVSPTKLPDQYIVIGTKR